MLLLCQFIENNLDQLFHVEVEVHTKKNTQKKASNRLMLWMKSNELMVQINDGYKLYSNILIHMN